MGTPLKVVHYLSRARSEVGGTVRAVLDLCSGLAAHGHRVILVTRDGSDVPTDWRGSQNVPEVVVLDEPGPSAWMSRSTLTRAREIIGSADALHVHGVWTVDNWRLCAVASAQRIPYCVSAHGMLDDWSMAQRWLKKRVIHRILVKQWLERARAVHLTAEAELEQAQAWFPRGRGVVVPNLFDVEPYRVAVSPTIAESEFPLLGRRRPILLGMSRLHYKKGFERLIRAARIAKDSGCDLTLVVAGSGERGYEDSLQRLVSELGLSDDTVFTGHVTGELKLSLYQAATLFVLPTSQENFGFVFLESLASETPVVTTAGVDIWPELKASGGAVISASDPDEIAKAVQSLLADRERLAAMGKRGHEWVFREFEPARIIQRFESMYTGQG